jgi:hypothetical protein
MVDGEVQGSVHRPIFQDRLVKTFCDVRLVAQLELWRKLQCSQPAAGRRCHARDSRTDRQTWTINTQIVSQTPCLHPSIPQSHILAARSKLNRTPLQAHATTLPSSQCFSTRIPQRHVPSAHSNPPTLSLSNTRIVDLPMHLPLQNFQ